jgi:hypothetical protein
LNSNLDHEDRTLPKDVRTIRAVRHEATDFGNDRV